MSADNGIVKIHNKDYKTVAKRIQEFRLAHPDWGIQTEVVEASNERVVVLATIYNKDTVLRSSGLAEEVRGSSNINKTSALENAETSAVGRALAFLGYAGTEIASADEVVNAINQQNDQKMYKTYISLTAAILENIEAITVIKAGINANEYSGAAEAWFELTNDQKTALWVAPSKGGVFTTKEREVIKTTEFRETYYGAPEPDEIPDNG